MQTQPDGNTVIRNYGLLKDAIAETVFPFAAGEST